MSRCESHPLLQEQRCNAGYWFTSGGNGNWVSRKRTVNSSYLSSWNGVKINAANGNLDLNAVNIYASSSDVSLSASGNVNLSAAQNWAAYSATGSGSVCNGRFFGACYSWTSWTDYYLREYLTAVPTSVYARNIQVTAGNDLNTYATKLTSWGGWTDLMAGAAANYYAVYNQTNFKDTRNTSSSFLGISYSKDTSISSSLTNSPIVTSLQSQAALTSYSGANTLLQGTYVNAVGGSTFRAGVGETARADARIILQGVKTTVQTAQTRESNYVLWQKLSGSGGTTETFALPSFVGTTTFNAPGGLVVQVPDGSPLKTQIQTLAAQPGMGYLNTLTNRSDVNWQPVKLAFDQWSYQQDGLTPAGAALVAVAVAWATGGTGASFLGSAGTTTTTVGGVVTTTYTTAGLIANAAFTSLATQASITLINNKGNVSKTLSDLASSNTAKAALTAVLTAGVMDKIGAMPGMQTLSSGAAFSDKLTFNLINATGRALTNAAINGGTLESALQAALVGGLVDTAQGAASSKIKLLEDQYVIHKLAHALAGCVAGAAAGGACQDGAIGAAVGEMVAGLMPPKNGIAYSDSEKANVLAMSKLVAGATSAYAGGDAQTAITTAEVAVQNNALVPVFVGLAWLADKAWTAYEVSQDIADIRDGNKTVEEVAINKGDEYVTAVILGNVGRYGVKAIKVGGKWVQSKDSLASTITENRSLSAKSSGGGMLGAKGTQTPSASVWLGTGKERIDVENPAPGVRAGQIHYQDNFGGKYFYQPLSGKFTIDPQGTTDAPKSIQKLLENKDFLNGINKALRYLGETK